MEDKRDIYDTNIIYFIIILKVCLLKNVIIIIILF